MHTVRDIFNTFGNIYLDRYNPSYKQLKVFNNIKQCRTKDIGIKIYKCHKCGKKIYNYKSCMDRHCSMCLDYKKELWIEKHNKDILNINYYHIVLCLPRYLYPLFYYNQDTMYNLLFKISSEVLLDLNKELLGIDIGITSILHTWSQKGKYYPHIHMLVTGGGTNNLGKWIDSELVNKELIKVRFVNKLIKILPKLHLKFYGSYSYLNNYDNYLNYLNNINTKDFICYKKKPYNSVKDIYEYFAKYAFRVWITNERIKDIKDGYVYYSYKNYDNKNEERISRVKGEEFIRRFLLHTLNKSFIKIRYYGILSCKNKIKKMKRLLIITKTKRIKDNLIKRINLLRKILKGKDVTRCPKCNGKLYLYKDISNNKSPPRYIHQGLLLNA